MIRSCGRGGPAAGFTLVEILVALALLGLVSMLMLSGIGLAGQGLDRLSARAQRLDERRSLEILMRRTLAAIVNVPVEDRPAFVGRPVSLSFLSVIGDGGPGLYRFTLALDKAQPRPAIVLDRRLAGNLALPRRDESVLVRDVKSFGIAYFGATSPAAEPEWRSNWEGIAYLPRLVRITIDTQGGREQAPLVFRLRDAF